MKPHELRIGNWIQDKGCSEPQQVAGIDELSCEVRNSPPFTASHPQLWEFIEPIPLTEEWLLKFGFENKSKYTAYKLNDRWNKRAIHNHRNGLTILIRAGHFTIKSHTLLQIKYVHQLQNIFFALTGEELTIKDLTP